MRMRHFSVFCFVFNGRKDEKKNRPFEYYTGLHEKNESKRGMSIYVNVMEYIHLYWIADTERIESFLTRNRNAFRYRNPYLMNSTVSA